jgi:hypothetical protein
MDEENARASAQHLVVNNVIVDDERAHGFVV